MYRNHYGRKNINYRGFVLLCIGIAIAIVIAIIAVPSYYTEKTYTATVTDKDIKNYNSSSKFLVFTKTEYGETRMFSMEDTLIKGR